MYFALKLGVLSSQGFFFNILQSLNPEGTDERLEVEQYQRSREQNEELGLTDMKTENY